MDGISKPAIYMWEDKVLYLGRLPPVTTHRFPVPVMAINLVKGFSLSTDRGESWSPCRSVLWPADYDHQTEYDLEDPMACLFMEPFGCYARSVERAMGTKEQGHFKDLSHEEEIADAFMTLYRNRPDIEGANSMLEEHLLKVNKESLVELDSRIESVIVQIKQSPVNKISVDDLAASVELSRVHLMQLFKKEVGAPIGTFQKWVKLLFVTRLMLSGAKVTNASMMANFSDVPHLTRTFRDALGLPPTAIFSGDTIDFFIDKKDLG